MKKKYNIFLIILFSLFLIIITITFYFSLKDGYNMSFGFIKDIIYKPFSDINNKNDLVGININQELKSENEELKKILNMGETLSSFSKICATVVERNQAYWLDSITINKGKKDGIDIGMAVVVSEGLIGKVYKITNETSLIKLITSSDNKNKISVKIKTEDSYIYKVLELENNNLVVKGIDNSITSLDEAIVVTSGLSDIYPSGIIIGKVKELKSDKYGTSKTAFINSEVNFQNLRFACVLKRV